MSDNIEKKADTLKQMEEKPESGNELYPPILIELEGEEEEIFQSSFPSIPQKEQSQKEKARVTVRDPEWEAHKQKVMKRLLIKEEPGVEAKSPLLESLPVQWEELKKQISLLFGLIKDVKKQGEHACGFLSKLEDIENCESILSLNEFFQDFKDVNNTAHDIFWNISGNCTELEGIIRNIGKEFNKEPVLETVLPVQAGEEDYLIPASYVSEAQTITPDEIESLYSNSECIFMKDGPVILFRLASLLNINLINEKEHEPFPVLSLINQKERIALLVEKIYPVQKVMIIPLGWVINSSLPFMGITISQKQGIQLILDIPKIFSLTKTQTSVREVSSQCSDL